LEMTWRILKQTMFDYRRVTQSMAGWTNYGKSSRPNSWALCMSPFLVVDGWCSLTMTSIGLTGCRMEFWSVPIYISTGDITSKAS
jgi:hypothetical protein